jgi:hypothetical protein
LESNTSAGSTLWKPASIALTTLNEALTSQLDPQSALATPQYSHLTDKILMPYERRPNFELFEIEKRKKFRTPWYVRKMTDEQRKAQQREVGKRMGDANKGQDRISKIKRKVLTNWGLKNRVKTQARNREELIQRLRAKYPDQCS